MSSLALAIISLHRNRLSRQFDRTLRQLRETQTERHNQEIEALSQGPFQPPVKYKMHKDKKLPYNPEEDGFVFANAEIETHITRHQRRTDATADRLALSSLFLGVIVLAVIGNAAEMIAATYFARQNRMDLVMGLCVGSSVQVALLVAPALVLISRFLGHPMNLIFSNPLELIAIIAMVFVVNQSPPTARLPGSKECCW